MVGNESMRIKFVVAEMVWTLLIHIVIIIIAILVLFGQLLVTRFDRLAKIFGGPEQRGSKTKGRPISRRILVWETTYAHLPWRQKIKHDKAHLLPFVPCWDLLDSLHRNSDGCFETRFVKLITAHFSMSRYVEPTLWRSQLPSLRLRAAS